jgi:hypothetical protein
MVPPPTAAPIAAPEAAPTVSAREAHPATPEIEANKAITIPVLNMAASVEMFERRDGLEQRSLLQMVSVCERM